MGGASNSEANHSSSSSSSSSDANHSSSSSNSSHTNSHACCSDSSRNSSKASYSSSSRRRRITTTSIDYNVFDPRAQDNNHRRPVGDEAQAYLYQDFSADMLFGVEDLQDRRSAEATAKEPRLPQNVI